MWTGTKTLLGTQITSMDISFQWPTRKLKAIELKNYIFDLLTQQTTDECGTLLCLKVCNIDLKVQNHRFNIFGIRKSTAVHATVAYIEILLHNQPLNSAPHFSTVDTVCISHCNTKMKRIYYKHNPDTSHTTRKCDNQLVTIASCNAEGAMSQ